MAASVPACYRPGQPVPAAVPWPPPPPLGTLSASHGRTTGTGSCRERESIPLKADRF